MCSVHTAYVFGLNKHAANNQTAATNSKNHFGFGFIYAALLLIPLYIQKVDSVYRKTLRGKNSTECTHCLSFLAICMHKDTKLRISKVK